MFGDRSAAPPAPPPPQLRAASRRSRWWSLRLALPLTLLGAHCDRSPPRPQHDGPHLQSTQFPLESAPLPLSEIALIDGQARGATSARGTLGVSVSHLTAERIRITFQQVHGATGYEVWLSAEPPRAGGALSHAHRMTTLDPQASREWVLEGLIPGKETFIVVRALGLTGVWGTVHVRLPVQPSERPQGSVRDVYAMSADVLGVVVDQRGLTLQGSELAHNAGAAWQGGAWTVRRANGDPIAVRSVSRHSVVNGQGGLEVGFGLPSRATVNVEHRLYLRLAAPLGQQEVLQLEHHGADGTDLSALMPFSDRYTETPLIRVNQVGYSPRARKRYAYVYGWLGDGGSLDLAPLLQRKPQVLIEPTDALDPRSTVPAASSLQLRRGASDDVVGPVAEIDLAALPAAEGRRYRVHIPGVGVSYPTAVSEAAVFKAFYTVARGLYHNRWCGDLRPDLTQWSRPADHCAAYFIGGQDTGFFPDDSRKVNERPVRGGHHDAGDFDLRPLHVLVAQALLRAYEAAPSKFTDAQLNLPESGNGVPDLLDEALWSLAAWEDLQDADGGVRRGVESTRHPAGYYFAHTDQLSYFAYDADADHTAYVSGLFAQAAHLVRPFDAATATRLVKAARRAYAYASSHEADASYLAFASGELARATGDESFRTAYQREWAALGVHGRGVFDAAVPAHKIYPGSIYGQHPTMADFSVAYASLPEANPQIRAVTLAELERWSTDATRAFTLSPQPFRSGRSPKARPDWGMDSSQGRFLDGVYQRRSLPGRGGAVAQAELDAMSLAADYMLGCNAAGQTFITGLGSRSPQQPLHLDSIAFQLTRDLPPVPGLVVYGPVESMPRAPYYAPIAAAFYPAFDAQPRALRFADAAQAVNMSEFSVWETMAPTALLFAGLLGDTEHRPWPELAPGEAQHASPLPPHTNP